MEDCVEEAGSAAGRCHRRRRSSRLAIVAAAAEIGSHAFLNRAVCIGHHTRLDAFVSVQAGANLGGQGRLCDEAEVALSCLGEAKLLQIVIYRERGGGS